MALNVTTIFEIRLTGSDSLNSGGFDPSQTAGMATDGTVDPNTGNTTTPIFSSATYSFVSGDTNAWVFIATGIGWYPGWYQITGVSGGKATLNAAPGSAVYFPIYNHAFVATSIGVHSLPTPSGATWTIDYSQQDFAQFSYTDITRVANTTCTSASNPFGRQQVGNILYISSGTAATPASSFAIQSVASGVATLNGTWASGATTNGVGVMGGALGSIGKFGQLAVLGNSFFLRSGTYPVNMQLTVNTASGRIDRGSVTNARLSAYEGYYTIRGDRPTIVSGTQPVLQATASASGATYVFGTPTWPSRIRYLTIDCNNQKNIGGITNNIGLKVLVTNISATGGIGFQATGTNHYEFCQAIGYSNTGGNGFNNFNGVATYCVAKNLNIGFNPNVSTFCIAVSCQTGFSQVMLMHNCLAYACQIGIQIYQNNNIFNCLLHSCTTGMAGVNTANGGNAGFIYNTKGYNCTNLMLNAGLYYAIDCAPLTSDPLPYAASGNVQPNFTVDGMINQLHTIWTEMLWVSPTANDTVSVGPLNPRTTNNFSRSIRTGGSL